MTTCFAAIMTWALVFHIGATTPVYGGICFPQEAVCLSARDAADKVFLIYGDYPRRRADCVPQAPWQPGGQPVWPGK